MKAPLSLAAAASLAACGQPSDPATDQLSVANRSAPKPVVAAAKAFSIEEKTDLIDFSFSWPAEAEAVPELAKRFRAERDKARVDLIAGAEEDKARRDKDGLDYVPFLSSTSYATAGQSPRLLSLSIEVGSYEGGAHGNSGVGALLWDRSARKEITFADLFTQPANRDRLLTQRWCNALNKAREEKRGEPVGGSGMFDDCPGLDEIAIVPADRTADGRFDQLMLVAPPYVAGPWVEGAYEIELAVTPELVAALKRDYQPSFEAQIRQ